MSKIHAWAAHAAGARLEPFEYDPGPLGDEQVEIAIEHCGICHSDLSMLDNEWGMTAYPLVPGHEGIGRVVALGPQALGLTVGQRVGIGWNAHSCLHCRAVPGRPPAPVRAGARHDHRPPRRLCRSRALPLGLGGALARCPARRRERTAAVRRHHRVRPARTAWHPPHRPRRRRRHWRAWAHGAEVLPRLGLRSHCVHLQRQQGGRGARFRRAPRRLQPRHGGHPGAGRDARSDPRHRERPARLERAAWLRSHPAGACTWSAPCSNRSRWRPSR